MAFSLDFKIFWVLLFFVDYSRAGFKRCYTCRSRGELGDCKDPFLYNASTIENLRGIDAFPCISGWCGKILEGQNQDFDAATERICVQRPPIDAEERCAETFFEKRRVYMCFCLGDLCNGSSSRFRHKFTIILASLFLYVKFRH